MTIKEHNAMCETCIHKVSSDDIDAIYMQGKKDERDLIFGIIENAEGALDALFKLNKYLISEVLEEQEMC